MLRFYDHKEGARVVKVTIQARGTTLGLLKGMLQIFNALAQQVIRSLLVSKTGVHHVHNFTRSHLPGGQLVMTLGSLPVGARQSGFTQFR